MMWMIQVCIASFWWYLGIHLLFREALVWASVDQIAWFRRRFGGPSTRQWERFCRAAGLICAVIGFLLFLGLPFGIGAFGLIIALPPLLFLL